MRRSCHRFFISEDRLYLKWPFWRHCGRYIADCCSDVQYEAMNTLYFSSFRSLTQVLYSDCFIDIKNPNACWHSTSQWLRNRDDAGLTNQSYI